MKKALAALLLLAACQKDEKVAPQITPPALYSYRLAFALEQERDSGYHHIYVATDKTNFKAQDSIPFHTTDSSHHVYEVKLHVGSRVKIISRSADTSIVSDIMEAL